MVMAIKFEKKSDCEYMLDVCGYVCPHPQIYSKKSLEKICEGDLLEVSFDNPSSAGTITLMCDALGLEIVEMRPEGGKFVFIIKKC
jgi:tRNA 2-thiouridine synthesizing protein A